MPSMTTTDYSNTLLEGGCKTRPSDVFRAHKHLTLSLRYNEDMRLAERRLPFNVNELKKAAASSINKPESDVMSIRKLAEGGFNRIFEVGMVDGTSILA